MKFILPFTAALALAAGAFSVWAQPQGGPPPGEHRGPPPEALTACKTAKAGADCSFAHDGRTETGSCWAPEGRPLACRPKNLPSPPPGGASAPPPPG